MPRVIFFVSINTKDFRLLKQYFMLPNPYPEEVHGVGPEQHAPQEEQQWPLGPSSLSKHQGPAIILWSVLSNYQMLDVKITIVCPALITSLVFFSPDVEEDGEERAPPPLLTLQELDDILHETSLQAFLGLLSLSQEQHVPRQSETLKEI